MNSAATQHMERRAWAAKTGRREGEKERREGRRFCARALPATPSATPRGLPATPPPTSTLAATPPLYHHRLSIFSLCLCLLSASCLFAMLFALICQLSVLCLSVWLCAFLRRKEGEKVHKKGGHLAMAIHTLTASPASQCHSSHLTSPPPASLHASHDTSWHFLPCHAPPTHSPRQASTPNALPRAAPCRRAALYIWHGANA